MHATLIAAVTDCQRYYEAQLAASWVPTYLTERAVHPAGAGYAPAGWSTTLDHLRARGHIDETLEAAGIARRSRDGRLIDALRDRLTVPVGGPENPRAFLARVNPHAADATAPKWLNTTTTPLWIKKRDLYGLEQADALRAGAMPIIVEGAFDVAAFNAARGGIHVRALAPCGTAFTAGHASWLYETIPPHAPIAVCLDADAAGEKAALRAWETLTCTDGFNGRQLLHVGIPAGQDPADLAARNPAELRQHLLRATPLALKVADLRIEEANCLDHGLRVIALAQHLVEHDYPHVHKSTRDRWISHTANRLTVPASELVAMVTESASVRASYSVVPPPALEPFTKTPRTARSCPRPPRSVR